MNKELEKCVIELRFLLDKLYLQFCDDELCKNCKLDINNGSCILNRLIATINALEKILYRDELSSNEYGYQPRATKKNHIKPPKGTSGEDA